MPKDKSTGKKLADMMYGNPNGAAFGITPMIGKRREDRQDREAAKSFPVDLARGVVAGAVGLPGDIESLARLPYELYTGNDSPTFLPTSEDVLKRIPFGTNTPAGQFASGLGTLAGGSANLGAIPRAVKAAPGALKAGARNLSAPRTLNPQAGVFIGPKAKTFHQGKADMAVAMEEAGRTPQEIWLATGTFRGADGILRQEISDRNALFNMPDALTEKVTAQKELINAKKELLRPDKSGQKDLFPKALTEAKRPVRQEIDELKGELREMDKSPRTQGVNAKYTLEHPELYAAYPELMDVPIVQNYKLGPLKGSLTSGGGKIYGMDVNDVKNPRSVALHEMQHAVQNIEGMSPGASPMMAFSTPEWKDLYKSYKDAYLARLPEGQTITMAMDDQLAQKAANRWYELQYGEAEARAVQARKDKTAQERAESFPYNSFDVNPKDMLTRKPFPNSGQTQSGSVHISDKPDVMQLELAAGGAVRMQAGGIAKLAKLARAPAKSKQEIQAIAERMAPQVTGEYVRESAKSAKTVAGKTQKQFQREKTLPVDVRATAEERFPQPVDIEKLKDEVMIGIPGDPTLAGKTLYGVGDVRLGSPSPQHGGPLYGLYNDPNFWASGEDAAKKVQNLARSVSELYDSPVLGNYIMMGPDSLSYAQHFADANLQAIDLSKMTKQQIEMFNEIIREGYNYKKKGERFQRVFPSFPGIEDKDSAYLHMAMDPDLRKHFNDVMQKPTVTESLNLPSGQDIRFAITEPALRDLESGVTGYSIGRMRPDVSPEGLKLSQHPTYSHDIPGQFMGTSKYPMPYELTFPDTVKSIRENPRQAPYEFGTLQYGSTHQTIDQQMIDEIRAYEERMKQLTGKKAGGAVRKAAGGEITADDLILEERKL